eukprot:g1885.t1
MDESHSGSSDDGTNDEMDSNNGELTENEEEQESSVFVDYTPAVDVPVVSKYEAPKVNENDNQSNSLLNFKNLELLLNSIVQHQQKQDKELQTIAKCLEKRVTRVNLNELRDALVERISDKAMRNEARFNHQLEALRIETETSILEVKENFQKQIDDILSGLKDLKEELRMTKVDLFNKASKSKMKAVEEELTECAHKEAVLEIREALGSKVSISDVAALQRDILMKASKTDIQRLATNLEGKMERGHSVLKEEFNKYTTKEESSNMEEFMSSKLAESSNNLMDAIGNNELNHNATKAIVLELQTKMQDAAFQSDVSRLEDTIAMLAPSEQLGRIATEGASRSKMLQLKIEGLQSELTSTRSNLDKATKEILGKASKVDVYQMGMKMEHFAKQEKVENKFKKTAMDHNALKEEITKLSEVLAKKIEQKDVPVYDQDIEKICELLDSKVPFEMYQEAIESKVSFDEYKETVILQDQMQTELAFLATNIDEIRQSQEKGVRRNASSKARDAEKRQEMISEMMAMREALANQQRQRQQSIMQKRQSIAMQGPPTDALATLQRIHSRANVVPQVDTPKEPSSPISPTLLDAKRRSLTSKTLNNVATSDGDDRPMSARSMLLRAGERRERNKSITSSRGTSGLAEWNKASPTSNIGSDENNRPTTSGGDDPVPPYSGKVFKSEIDRRKWQLDQKRKWMVESRINAHRQLQSHSHGNMNPMPLPPDVANRSRPKPSYIKETPNNFVHHNPTRPRTSGGGWRRKGGNADSNTSGKKRSDTALGAIIQGQQLRANDIARVNYVVKPERPRPQTRA